MYQFQKSLSLKTNLEKLFKFHLDPKNLRLLSSPSMNLKIITSSAPISKNSEVKIKFNLIPFVSIHWDFIIEEVVENELIIDLQTKGPFKFWRHKHIFQKLFDGTVVMTDEIEYEMKWGLLGKLLNPIIKWRLNQMFKMRHKIIKSLFGG